MCWVGMGYDWLLLAEWMHTSVCVCVRVCVRLCVRLFVCVCGGEEPCVHLQNRVTKEKQDSKEGKGSSVGHAHNLLDEGINDRPSLDKQHDAARALE